MPVYGGGACTLRVRPRAGDVGIAIGTGSGVTGRRAKRGTDKILCLKTNHASVDV